MLKTVPIKGFIFIGSADGHLPHFTRQETDRFCFVMQLSCRSEEKNAASGQPRPLSLVSEAPGNSSPAFASQSK